MIAIYPGTFDPITLGHYDVIKRATQLFTAVHIAINTAQHKKTLFSLDERVMLCQTVLADLPNVSVSAFDGLLVDFARTLNAQVIVRGLRNTTDYNYECAMATTNHTLAPTLDTVLLAARPPYHYISSTVVREIAATHSDLTPFVPKAVAEYWQHTQRHAT